MYKERRTRNPPKSSKHNIYTRNYSIRAFQYLAKSPKDKPRKAPKLLAPREDYTIIFSHKNESDNSLFLKIREFLSIQISHNKPNMAQFHNKEVSLDRPKHTWLIIINSSTLRGSPRTPNNLHQIRAIKQCMKRIKRCS